MTVLQLNTCWRCEHKSLIVPRPFGASSSSTGRIGSWKVMLFFLAIFIKIASASSRFPLAANHRGDSSTRLTRKKYVYFKRMSSGYMVKSRTKKWICLFVQFITRNKIGKKGSEEPDIGLIFSSLEWYTPSLSTVTPQAPKTALTPFLPTSSFGVQPAPNLQST